MKHLAIMILIVGISRPFSAQAVRTNPAPQQSTGRASYDPMAHGKQTGQPKSIVETTLAGVNPQDKDYGSVVADWRKEVFENTLQTLYFWGLLGTSLALGISIVGNGWLLRQRDQRLTVSADIVAQLYNAYVTSRARTLEVIGKHNRLVEKYDRLDAEAAELRGRIANAEMRDPASDNQAELNFDNAMKDRVPLPSPEHNNGGSEASVAQKDGLATTEVELLGKKLAEAELQLQRQGAQLHAKTNEITNLRSRLSKAHDAFEGQFRQTNARS
jgi:hypothetical protein